jgi:hypothetical protein
MEYLITSIAVEVGVTPTSILALDPASITTLIAVINDRSRT